MIAPCESDNRPLKLESRLAMFYPAPLTEPQALFMLCGPVTEEVCPRFGVNPWGWAWDPVA